MTARHALHFIPPGHRRGYVGIDQRFLNVTITGLKFFFASTLDPPELTRHMHPVHKPRKIPIVLSQEEIARLIGCAGNLKNQTALSVAYGAGLRVSEVVALTEENGPERITFDGASRLAFHPARPPSRLCGNRSAVP